MKAFLTKQTFTLLAAGVLIVGAIIWLERPIAAEACENTQSSLIQMSFEDEDGVCKELSQLAAPVTVVNVWATWCPFCVEELPDLGRLAQEFPDIPVVAINRAEPAEVAQEFLATLDIGNDVHFLFDPNDAFYKEIDGFGMPETVFIDEEGTILFHKRGVMSLEEMRGIIELLTGRVQPNASVKNNSLCLGDGEACALEHLN